MSRYFSPSQVARIVTKEGPLIQIRLRLRSDDAFKIGKWRAKFSSKEEAPAEHFEFLDKLRPKDQDSYETILMDEAAKQSPFKVELGRPKRTYNQNLAAVFHGLHYPEAMYSLHDRVIKEFEVLMGPPRSKKGTFRPKFNLVNKLSSQMADDLLRKAAFEYKPGALQAWITGFSLRRSAVGSHDQRSRKFLGLRPDEDIPESFCA